MTDNQTRREWMKTLAVGSIVVSGGTATVTGDESTSTGGISPAVDPIGTYVVLEHLETGQRYQFQSYEAVDWASVPDGEYDLERYERRHSGTVVSRRRTDVRTDASVESEHLEINSFAGGQTHDGIFVPGSTVPLFVGVVDTDGIVDTPASDPLDVTITVTDPDGNAQEFSRTVENGSLRFEYDTSADDPTGSYDYQIQAVDGNFSAFGSFTMGQKQSISNLADNAFPGEEVTVGVDVTENGEPADGDVDVDVTFPSGTQETRTVTAQNGVATLSVTPQETGSLQFDTATPGFNSLDVTEYIVVLPEFDLRSQQAGDPAEIFGHVQTTSGAATNTEFDIVVTNTDDDSTVADTTVTTDDLGLFTFSWETNADQEQTFSYELSPSDSDETILNQTVSTLVPDDGGETSASLSVSYDVRETTPGEEATVTVSLSDDAGDPVPNQDVELVVAYGFSFNGVPIDSATVTTDANGEATYTFTLPSDAPDGQTLRTVVGTTLDGEELTGEAFGDIARYQTGFSNLESPRAGQSWDFTVTSTKPPNDNDEPVSDQSMRVFTGTDDYLQTIHDTASVVTDSNGEASVTADIGTDAQNRLGVDIINDYWSTSRQWVPPVSRFESTVEGVPDSPQAGETLSVSITDASGTERTAVVLFNSFSVLPISLDVAEPGSPAEITIPAEAAGSFGDIELYAVEDGKVHREREFLEVSAGTVAQFSYSPAEPVVGDEITFDGTDSTSDAGELTYEWDLTGDGSVDATGDVVTRTYESTGEYDVTLTVTDEDGTSDETTQALVVDPDPVDEYRDENGDVTTEGLRTAVDDWRAGQIDAGVLQDVLDEWGA